ncbi:MAG: flagellar hook-basal body complex protein FliE [Rhodospirillaceae bacterium]|jgi:flagellar hook-basal body complex protein FliE|nr:flagellar hook-basal body complex protein FliE [Rhodospirillaceae bacterium]MBT4218485.1 flagellar hook-basal body complex protein FliE [Rhodospirillaceae bacterium]MBT4464472.1 flagellar hook-basal body complex protein FliE [Rhodospirillaceae bacterium]MBT5014622.1 flagellar hook-basal body complex protein FliE [Rhodospirillaceae bacterium]MBT5309249.1 flagellar hook-basal body complex protein FliE [Rhodospirillaceae bacterium]
MAIPVQNVANAVAAYAKSPQNAGAGMEARDAGQDSPFAGLVKGAIKEAVKIGEKQEAISLAAINDRADMNQVVTAIAEAEATLQVVVAVRDKVVDAYKEILRMPV